MISCIFGDFSCRENICHIVKAPANMSWKIRELATDIASRAVSSLEGAGVFAVELFLTKDDQVAILPLLTTWIMVIRYLLIGVLDFYLS